jgi:phosphoglycolate phosphatase-like HAD superfamily hydrolase
MNKLFTILIVLLLSQALYSEDPLPSWNEGSTKSAIIQFVKDVTTEGAHSYVHPKDRIATFDQDGTLWVEQPIYTQVIFAIDELRALAPQHPEWQTTEPFKTILSGDKEALSQLSIQDVEKIVAVTHSGMSVKEFNDIVKKWIDTTQQPRFHKLYTQLVYQPMIEVIKYLRDNHFIIYIVSGGGQEFIRVYSEPVYGISSEFVIGSAQKVKYEYNSGHPSLTKLPEILIVDDKTGKPEAINLFIGKRPIFAFGNSDGDRQMLEWTQSNTYKNIELLVHHDDTEREYAYGRNSKVGTFSESLMEQAKRDHWYVVSMKEDWKVIFPK